jgi:hypothetical protein
MAPPENARRRGRGRGLALAAALALLAACGGDEERAGAPPAPPPRSAPAAVAEDAGALRVERAGEGRFRVRAKGASRFLVLQELARVAHFSIRPGIGAAPPLLLDLDLDEVSAETALARILRGVPYHLHYEAEPAGRAEVALRRVTVGLLPPEIPLGAAQPLAADRAPRRAGDARGAIEAFAESRRQRAVSDEERRAEIESHLHSRIEEDRVLAASLMRVEEDLPALAELLASDPSPAVRAAAAASLGDAEGGESAYGAVDALIGVLGDGDAGVVAAAIGALEDLHDLMPDPRIREAVAALARHGDPKVRGAVASFREWTEDEP